MLNDTKFFATVAVKDITKAKVFYGDTLELAQVAENPRGVTYQTGGGNLFVYQSPSAGTGQASVATWEMENMDEVVRWLQGRGIVFETYDMPGATWDNGVATMDQVKVAWFKDPDGNLFSVGTPQPE